MKENRFKLLVVLIVLIGNVFSLIVTIHQMFTNMFGFWFWFSFNSTLGWGMLVALMNDTDFLDVSQNVHLDENE